MTANFNTIRAMMTAKNYAGARRQIKKILEENPENTYASELAIEIEFESNNHKKVLELTKNLLAQNPLSYPGRDFEIRSLAILKKKKECRQKIEAFKIDFPNRKRDIEGYEFLLHSIEDKRNKAVETLDRLSKYYSGDKNSAQIGEANLRLGNLFVSYQQLKDATETIKDDYKLYANLAVNCFAILRYSEARKYAKLALTIEPKNWRMRLVIVASFLGYFPVFLIMSFSFCIMLHLLSRFNKVLVFMSFLAVYIFGMSQFINFVLKFTGVLAAVNYRDFDHYITIGWVGIWLFIINYGRKSVFDAKTKTVKLKKF